MSEQYQTRPFEPGMRGQLTKMVDVKKFCLAGNATITLVSKKTGTRFTYKIRRQYLEDDTPRDFWFVQLLTGSDNETDFTYLGQIKGHQGIQGFYHGAKSPIGQEAPSYQAFNWFWGRTRSVADSVLNELEVWHEGRCGRCNRKLTVPESIEQGFGPECINYV